MSVYKQYLGDSVYADFDGYHIILTTENGKPDDPSNRIAIESDVFNALTTYASELNAQLERESRRTSRSEGGS